MAEDIFESLLASTSTDELERQRDEYKAQIVGLNSRIAVLNSLLSHRRAMDAAPGDPLVIETDPPMTRPSIAQAALIVMATKRVGYGWTADELYDELEQRAWLPGGKTPRNTMQATMSRLVKTRQLERPMQGIYTLPADHRRVATRLDQEGG